MYVWVCMYVSGVIVVSHEDKKKQYAWAKN